MNVSSKLFTQIWTRISLFLKFLVYSKNYNTKGIRVNVFFNPRVWYWGMLEPTLDFAKMHSIRLSSPDYGSTTLNVSGPEFWRRFTLISDLINFFDR